MQPINARTLKLKSSRTKLVREVYGGEPYEYYPLGKHVVSAPGVCGGRPTFKYTRLEVSVVLALIASGEAIEQVVQDYSLSQLTPESVQEAIQLADQALIQLAGAFQPAAA
ncbi:MAG: DUF433 domain-containing protein [Anaerolineae bacterium]